MPHKRAKRSVRLANSEALGYDNVPTANDSLAGPSEGGLSKGLYRVLHAERIRRERKEKAAARAKQGDEQSQSDVKGKKRKRDGEGEDTADANANAARAAARAEKLKIKPGESLKSYNNRVEIAMRPSISSAIKTSKSTRKKAKLSRSAQAKQDADEEEARLYKPPPRPNASGKERASEFAGREKVALNDIAQEPPTLVKMQNKKAEKALQANVKSKSKKELPVSMKQKEEMEQERQKAIAMYRDLKAKQTASSATS